MVLSQSFSDFLPYLRFFVVCTNLCRSKVARAICPRYLPALFAPAICPPYLPALLAWPICACYLPALFEGPIEGFEQDGLILFLSIDSENIFSRIKWMSGKRDT